MLALCYARALDRQGLASDSHLLHMLEQFLGHTGGQFDGGVIRLDIDTPYILTLDITLIGYCPNNMTGRCFMLTTNGQAEQFHFNTVTYNFLTAT